MKIIDAHVHAFRTLSGFGAKGEFRSIGGGKGVWATGEVAAVVPPQLYDDGFPAETLLGVMDSNNVEKAVLLQGGFLGFENYYIKEILDAFPGRFAGAATFDPFCRYARQILENHIQNLRFKIFKFEMSPMYGIMGNHAGFSLDSPWLMAYYAQIAAVGGVFVFDIGTFGDDSSQIEAVCSIADAFPCNDIVVCHLLLPRKDGVKVLVEKLGRMKRPNLHFDLSALFWDCSPNDFPFSGIRDCAARAKDIVGSEHLMWGSDAPSTLCKVPYNMQISYLMDIFSPAEQEAVYYRNANRIYFQAE